MKIINFKNFTSAFLTICAIVFGLTATATAAVKPELVSRSSDDVYGNGNSQNFSASADGRYIVFQSAATNLVSGITDTNNGTDIFLRDTLNGTTRCLSCTPAANSTSTANDGSSNPIITPDGRYVVFVSKASDLVSGVDANNNLDVFRFDTQTNERVLVSASAASPTVAGNNYSGIAVNGRGYDVSDDGRYIAFVSNASNLTNLSDTNDKGDVFIRDMLNNQTRLISRGVNGAAGNNESFDASISANGQYLAFTSLSDNLLPGNTDGNRNYDVFVYDADAQQLKCASMSTRTDIVTTGSSASVTPSISKDGNRVVYFTYANDITNIQIPFANPYNNIVVYDVGFGQNSLVTVNTAGNAAANNTSGSGNYAQQNVSISANGRYVTFESKAGNLSTLTTSAGNYNVFRRDLARGFTEVVSVTSTGAAANNGGSFAGEKNNAMSSDGRFVTFVSNFSILSEFPATGRFQVYVRDMTNGITSALTLNNAGTALANGDGAFPRISANGKSVVFASAATDLTPTPTSNQYYSVFKSNVQTPQRAVSDFDGDGKTDYAVWRPASGYWYVLPNSGNYLASSILWGANGDQIVPSDYTGDGRADYAVFRPSNGSWYITNSATFGAQTIVFGQSGDKPMPADYNGDGKTEVAVFRPSTGYWYIARTTGVPAQNFDAVRFGLSTDIPVAGDFDGDGKADIAVYRPSNGYWYILRSTNGQVQSVQYGNATDKPVTGDFDGDGKTDIAVFRSGVFYILESRTGDTRAVNWGFASDLPVIGDYDGDGKADVAIFRPSTGGWSVVRSSSESTFTVPFGQNGDAPAPAALNQ